MNHFRTVCVIGLAAAAAMGGVMACGSDPPVTPVVDAGNDVTVTPDAGKDAVADTGGGTDSGTDAPPPCAEAGATIKVGDNSGVQCTDDGGQLFCSKTISVCCVGANGAKCNAKNAGCGGQAITYECDKASDCSDGGVCCLKNVTNPQGCKSSITTDQGTYCAAQCTGSDIKMCNGDQAACFNGTCTNLHLADAPGKVLSGCL